MNGAIRMRAAFAAPILTFILGGCVLGTRNPTLTYPPAAESGAVLIAA
jgi:hypothetical protein